MEFLSLSMVDGPPVAIESPTQTCTVFNKTDSTHSPVFCASEAVFAQLNIFTEILECARLSTRECMRVAKVWRRHCERMPAEFWRACCRDSNAQASDVDIFMAYWHGKREGAGSERAGGGAPPESGARSHLDKRGSGGDGGASAAGGRRAAPWPAAMWRAAFADGLAAVAVRCVELPLALPGAAEDERRAEFAAAGLDWRLDLITRWSTAGALSLVLQNKPPGRPWAAEFAAPAAAAAAAPAAAAAAPATAAVGQGGEEALAARATRVEVVLLNAKGADYQKRNVVCTNTFGGWRGIRKWAPYNVVAYEEGGYLREDGRLRVRLKIQSWLDQMPIPAASNHASEEENGAPRSERTEEEKSGGQPVDETENKYLLWQQYLTSLPEKDGWVWESTNIKMRSADVALVGPAARRWLDRWERAGGAAEGQRPRARGRLLRVLLRCGWDTACAERVLRAPPAGGSAGGGGGNDGGGDGGGGGAGAGEGAGVPHVGVACDGCGRYEFPGTRWKCQVCRNYDLCGACHREGRRSYGHRAAHPAAVVEPYLWLPAAPGRHGGETDGGGGGGGGGREGAAAAAAELTSAAAAGGGSPGGVMS